MLDKEYVQRLKSGETNWALLFQRGVSQSLIKQYTNSVNTFSTAIEQNPSNPFLYLNPFDDPRRNDRLHLLDRQLLSADIDRLGSGQPAEQQLETNVQLRRGVADLNKAIKLFPAFAEAYYTAQTLRALSGSLPEAYEDYSKAIELNPAFAEAY